jgi:hypothetical protein
VKLKCILSEDPKKIKKKNKKIKNPGAGQDKIPPRTGKAVPETLILGPKGHSPAFGVSKP